MTETGLPFSSENGRNDTSGLIKSKNQITRIGYKIMTLGPNHRLVKM